MKNIIISSISLSKILIIEQAREPVGTFWSLIVPPLLFLFINLDNLNKLNSIEWYAESAVWYISYISLSVSMFSFSLYLVGRRESGFLKLFLQNKKSIKIFLISQFFACFIISLVGFFLFIVLTTFIFDVSMINAFLDLTFKYIVVSFIMLPFSLVVSIIPITFQQATTSYSILFSVFIFMSLAGLRSNNEIINFINIVNPISIAAELITLNTISLLIVFSVIAPFMCFFGYKYLRINPIWTRQ